jgi:oligopeptide/dipeptide ABC transporter ATP-binding protein
VTASDCLLRVRGLSTHYELSDEERVVAVEDVSFVLERGQTLGVVGESGCGKSAMARSLISLVPRPGRVVEGEIVFDGQDLLSLSPGRLRRLRGSEIGFVPQDPLSSLNPLIRVVDQVAETLIVHTSMSKQKARARAVELLDHVGIKEPARRARDYPHELSGGMRQRVAIAMAIAAEPKLLIADEPTTALDVTTQAQVLALVKRLSVELEMSVVLITHDFGVAAQMCDQVMVMYAGRVVESGPTREVLHRPQMPYTRALLNAMPTTERAAARLHVIAGSPPDLARDAVGCRFAPRCQHVRSGCVEVEPALLDRGSSHRARCLGTEVGGWVRW